jgi:putative ABC transport system permease protein
MSLVWKLAFAYITRHSTRTLLTAAAIVASVCVVVWVASTYDATAAKFDQQAAGYVGCYDFFIIPEDEKNAYVDAGLAAPLRRDTAVAEVATAIQTPIDQLTNPNRGWGGPGGFGMGPGGWGGMGSPGMMPGGFGMGHGRWDEMGGPGMESRGTQTGGPPGPGGTRLGGPGGTWRGRRGGMGSGGRGGMGPGGRGGMGPGGPGGALTLVGTDAAGPPRTLAQGDWIDPENLDQRGAVLGQSTAKQTSLSVGDEFLVILGPKEYRLKVCGLLKDVESGTRMGGPGRRMLPPGSSAPATGIEAGPAASAVYVPLELAKKFTRGKGKINLISVQLKSDKESSAAEFRRRWAGQVAKSRPVVSLLGIDDVRANLVEGAAGQRHQAWAATGLSLLAALFIIFTTLSMGATERVRQFAVMRAVGLSRGQVAAVIAAEGLLLALVGWVVGLLAGRELLMQVDHWKPDVLGDKPVVGTWCIALAALTAFGGAAAASIFPAWQATRVQPLEAMTPRRTTHPNTLWTVTLAVVGGLLIAVNPILVYVAATSISADAIYYVYMAAGCTTMAVGFLLLTPATIVIAERLLGPCVARLLGLDPRLLRSQLSSNLWRTLGTTAALTVGLGLYVAFQIWGFSMLEPFKPAAWVPDMLVALQSGGLPDGEINAVGAIEGVRPGQCLPLAVEQPRLAEDITGSKSTTSVIAQNNVIMIGLDPQAAFGGTDPLLKVRFVEGTPSDAVAKLKQGRNCIVPDHFLKAARLKLGDRFSVVPPDAPSQRIQYTIVGAVSLPGWHWMTKFSGLRRREGRSAAMVFADYDTVRRDFHLHQVNFLWMNVDTSFGEKYLEEVRQTETARLAEEERWAEIRKKRSQADERFGGPPPMVVECPVDARRAAVVKVAEALQTIADRHQGEQQPVNAQGAWEMGATMFGRSLRVTTPDEVLAFITVRASGMIWALCYLPLLTLLVTSLGVVNTVMASVRARRWEFGILRSQGVTRSGLFRMILAEGLLIGLITCLLSLGFGILSGWCGAGISQYVSFFGGLAPPLVVPWAHLALGFGMALALCLAAALWPAVSTGRAEPLQLLQAGRAAL